MQLPTKITPVHVAILLDFPAVDQTNGEAKTPQSSFQKAQTLSEVTGLEYDCSFGIGLFWFI